MHRLKLALCLGVAACTPKYTTDGPYRQPALQMYSIAGFDLARLEGEWDQVAAFASGANAACPPGKAAFRSQRGQLNASYQLCLSGQNAAGTGTVAAVGPGRFEVSGKGSLAQDWWVLWVDESYRTLAIGTPSGQFGFILNRGRSLPADRLAAAKEVMDFNGYDVEKLVLLSQ